ncbi:TetR/AcrR family transcriptional regulator [Croceicoccus sp. F390]|uniref:TetR/AcrR family transcriptional regulator n=1 Tax=Croceicoccus esteveae TaxID=3075597 RepID=A0ABU2ZES6_9SPHN|nr:TetR/AcrR family transcriptional regulator [Croceicoccus sp. F390]MDT0574716.1 TetR/AcrR family transcriptional regulator [Croceicoccus sp. F390]
MAVSSSSPRDSTPREPRTERGRRTLRKLLDAAAAEFGERGFHDASISDITRRAGIALGSFYTYFDSKNAIFKALVSDLSAQVRSRSANSVARVTGALAVEEAALAGFLAFSREQKEIYRIIDEAEFVDPASYREHYESTAARILQRLRAGMETGELRAGLDEDHAWAIMGMNVFLGLRYAIWDDEAPIEKIARTANGILRDGIACSHGPDQRQPQ